MSPPVFDKVIAERTGLNLKSYNLSVPGASLVELIYIVENYLAAKGCCVKYLVVEPDFSFLDILRQPGSPRAAQFLNVRNAYDMLQYVRHFNIQPVPAITPHDYIKNILLGIGLHYSHAGMVRALFDVKQVDYRIRPNERGFETYPGSLTETLAAQSEAREAYAYHTNFLTQFSGLGPNFDRTDPVLASQADYLLNLVSRYQFNIFVSLLERLQARGIAVVVLRTPQIAHSPYALSFAGQYRLHCSAGPPLLDFGSPRNYPKLFAPANRIDVDHLNRQGAAIFSEALADEMAALIQGNRLGNRQAQPCEAW
jgi:hypothetical protein